MDRLQSVEPLFCRASGTREALFLGVTYFPRALITTAAPSAPTAALPVAAAPDEPHDEQQQDSAYRGVGDCRDNSGTKIDTEPRQQPSPNEGTDNADDEITNESKTGPAHDLTSQPAGN
jgi:hypothetical protein